MKKLLAVILILGAAELAWADAPQAPAYTDGTSEEVQQTAISLMQLWGELSAKSNELSFRTSLAEKEKLVAPLVKAKAKAKAPSAEDEKTALDGLCKIKHLAKKKERIDEEMRVIWDLAENADDVSRQASNCKAQGTCAKIQSTINIFAADINKPSSSPLNPSSLKDVATRKAKLAGAWTSSDTAISRSQSSKTSDAKLSAGAQQAHDDTKYVSSELSVSQTAANLQAEITPKAQPDGACGDKDVAEVDDDTLQSRVNNALAMKLAYNAPVIDDKLKEITQDGFDTQARGDNPPPKPVVGESSEQSSAAYEKKVENEANLLALLAKFPDTNFTGTNKTATLQAGTSGSNATLTYGFEHLDNFGDNLFSGTLSAPTSSSGSSTSLYDHADGFINVSNLKINDTFVHNASIYPNALIIGGVSGQFGYQQHQYYVLSDLKSEQTSNKYPWGAGFYLGSAWLDQNGNPDVLTFNASVQRSNKDQKSETVCPSATAGSDTVMCVNGPINEPSSTTAGVFSLAFRRYLANVAFSPAYSINTNTHVKEFDLPIYAFHTSDKASSSTLNGGFDLNWTNTQHWNFGVFVGAPIPPLGGN